MSGDSKNIDEIVDAIWRKHREEIIGEAVEAVVDRTNAKEPDQLDAIVEEAAKGEEEAPTRTVNVQINVGMGKLEQLESEESEFVPESLVEEAAKAAYEAWWNFSDGKWDKANEPAKRDWRDTVRVVCRIALRHAMLARPDVHKVDAMFGGCDICLSPADRGKAVAADFEKWWRGMIDNAPAALAKEDASLEEYIACVAADACERYWGDGRWDKWSYEERAPWLKIIRMVWDKATKHERNVCEKKRGSNWPTCEQMCIGEIIARRIRPLWESLGGYEQMWVPLHEAAEDILKVIEEEKKIQASQEREACAAIVDKLAEEADRQGLISRRDTFRWVANDIRARGGAK